MKTIKYYRSVIIFPILAIALSISGCAGIPEGGAPRNKMPELNHYDAIENPEPYNGIQGESQLRGFAFQTVNSDINFNGKSQQAISISLANRSTDSLAISLVRSFKPLALPLLSVWAQQQRDGVLLNLSAGQGSTYRTEFILECGENVNIPVVLIWDQFSSSRMVSIKNLISEVPEFHLKYRAGDYPESILPHHN